MSNTNGSRNNKRLTFLDTKSHCANVTRFANATLRHYSKSSEHSRNSLGRRSTGFLHTLKALINVFNIFQFGISDWTRESREGSLYSQLLDLPHSAFLIKFSTVVGVPTLVREYSECYQNSQRFYCDWDFQHTLYSHLKF